MEKNITYKDNDITLKGILNINNKSDNTIAVICHARYSSKNSRPTSKITEILNENNLNNFRFDFVACGEASGEYRDYTITKMLSNLHTTLKMLKEKYNFQNFILIGCSLGARIVSLVDYKEFNITKLVLWYGALDYKKRIIPSKKEKIAKKLGFYEIENGNRLSYEYFKDEKKYNAFRRLKHWNVAKIFIHGDKDQFVNINSSIKISKKSPNSKLVIIQNGDHGFHNDKCLKEALKETINFLGY